MPPTDFSEADRIMQDGIASGVFPGAVLLVRKGGRLLFHAPYGKADLFAGDPVTEETLFDLASLTKPLAAALCAMALADRGRLRLDDRLGDLLPAFSETDKAGITVSHLLCHTAGLPDYRPYFETLVNRPQAARPTHLQKMLVEEAQIIPAGKKTRYSDIGFLVLQQALEALAGSDLSAFCSREIFSPLGLGSLHFPKNTPPFPLARYAATEKCPWRKRVLRGEVHDENAWALGGVGGHAGLFGTAADVGRLGQVLLDAWTDGAEAGPLSAETIRRFLSPPSAGGRAFGFDVPDPVSPSCGRRFSSRAVGHLGFTGTSFWIDPESTLIVVLLTNRVHPTRENQKIRAFRPKIHDAVCLAVT